MGLNFFITAQGFSTISMATVLIGAVTNIVLDPIFIFRLNMGVKGAALATITAQAVSALWVVRFLCGKRTRLRLQKRYFRISPKVLAPVVALGLSPFIMNATESLVNVAFNASLKAYGGTPAVGAMTICSSVLQIMFLLLQGIAQGAQPIIGFNYGSGRAGPGEEGGPAAHHLRSPLQLYGLSGVGALPQAFVLLFNDKPELVDLAVWALRIYAAGMFMLGIQSACQQTFVALGEAKISLFLALLRKIILLLPLILLLPHLFADKVFGVFLAEPAADILAATVTGLMFLWRFPRILRRREQELRHADG